MCTREKFHSQAPCVPPRRAPTRRGRAACCPWRRRKNEANNNKFAFLKPGDPFNPYYAETVIANGGKPPAGAADAAASAKISGESTVKPVKKAAAGVMPLEPPKPQYIVNRPAGAQPLDMDVIMLTAQFVARNGRSFLTGLANRESKNPMFDFLKPTHRGRLKSESAAPPALPAAPGTGARP